MAGPTPVSALIHAATMVVAGIFLVARFYGVFYEGLSIGTANLNLLAIVGAVTVVFGALLAFVQNDIKKVLAYSTVSQLGYMAMALGRRCLDGRRVPPLHPRVLQGRTVPRVGLGRPRGAQLRHEGGHGRHAEVHAADVRDVPHLHGCPDRDLPDLGLLVEGRDPRRRPPARRRRRLPADVHHGSRRCLLHRRLHDALRLPHLPRRAARPRRRPPPPAPRVRSAHPRAAVHPGRPGARRRIREPPGLRRPRMDPGLDRLALRALRRAGGAVLPRDPPRRVLVVDRRAGGRARLPRHRSRLRLLLAAPVQRRDGAEPRGPRRPHAAGEQVLLRPPLHRRHRRRRPRARSPGPPTGSTGPSSTGS